MAKIQDIRELEWRITDAVLEYLDYPDGYENPVLHIYLDQEEMEHRAEVDNAAQYGEDKEIYPIHRLIRQGEEGDEVDFDEVSCIANSWIFIT